MVSLLFNIVLKHLKKRVHITYPFLPIPSQKLHLHLPPELSETASRAQEDATPPTGGAPRRGRGAEGRKTVGGEGVGAESGRTHSSRTQGSSSGVRQISKHNIDF